MDSEFRVNIAEVTRGIETAQVICILFPLLQRSLVVDTRYDQRGGPLVRVMPPVGSVEERMRVLRRLRPRFPSPQSLSIIPWPKYVDSLCRLGLWDKLVQRFIDSAHPEAVQACEAAFNELVALERREILHAVTGENCQTLWQRDKQ